MHQIAKKEVLKVFVAGGTGVVGLPSLRALVEGGHQVRSSARGAEKAALVRTVGAEPVDVNLFDPASVRKAVDGCDAVIRLTTKIGPLLSMRKEKAWAETNRLRTEGARILVDAAMAARVPVYINESVSYVYGDQGDKWISESDPVDDAGTTILRATLEGERETQRFTSAGGRGIVLRFAGFYGETAPSTLETIQMMKRRMFTQVGPATNFFSSIYLADAGRAVAAALTAPAGIYNISDDDPVLFRDYLRTLANATGAPKPARLPGFLRGLLFADVGRYLFRSLRVSNAKFKRESGWKPTFTSVRQGWPEVARLTGSSKQRATTF